MVITLPLIVRWLHLSDLFPFIPLFGNIVVEVQQVLSPVKRDSVRHVASTALLRFQELLHLLDYHGLLWDSIILPWSVGCGSYYVFVLVVLVFFVLAAWVDQDVAVVNASNSPWFLFTVGRYFLSFIFSLCFLLVALGQMKGFICRSVNPLAVMVSVADISTGLVRIMPKGVHVLLFIMLLADFWFRNRNIYQILFEVVSLLLEAELVALDSLLHGHVL